MSRSPVTLRDVARRAGVSHQTVSRVVNGSRHVRPETRARVEAAIAELDYRPNALARSMARGRSATLACISPNLTDYTFASIIDGAEGEARRRGYFLLSASAPDETTFAALMDQLVSSRRTEGILVINPYADRRHELLPEGFPLVFAGARPRAESANSVALDDVAAARLATQHLLDLGHRAIGLVTGPMAEDCSQDRLAGFAEALTATGLAPDPALIAHGDWGVASGYRALYGWHAAGRLPEAVFAQNDQMAVGVLRAARELGLDLPARLSVIGVDDIPLAAYFTPPLTTARQDFAAIGRQAASLLAATIKQPESARQHILVPATLIERGSTAPPSP